MPSLSKRISIAWDGGQPFEDTDTLVIVGNTYFVDVRIKRKTGDLDWALAGVKEWVNKDSEPPRARFTPSLSSRPPPPGSSDSADEGTFSELPNGDSMETGVMYDPEDGRVKPYEEIWRDLPASGLAFILELETKGDMKDEEHLEKAWVGMMGDYQLMVAKLAGGTYAAWTAINEGTWRILRHVGMEDVKVPLLPVPMPDIPWKAGETIETTGLKWLVREYFLVP